MDESLEKDIILPQPLSPGKIITEQEALETQDVDMQSNILGSLSNATDDIIGISDIPIMGIEVPFEEPLPSDHSLLGNIDSSDVKEINLIVLDEPDNSNITDQLRINLANNTKKPKGSAYVHVKIKLKGSHEPVEAYVSVDTGADATLCFM